MKNITALFLLSIFVSSCASIYLAPNGKSIANKHETIAIVIPKVSIKARKKDDAEAIKESQRTSSFEFQQEIYKYLLKRKTQGKMQVNIQDVEETNAILERSNIKNLTTKEMCELLEVDAIMTSNFGLTKPMSTGGAIALVVLTGWGASTNAIAPPVDIGFVKPKLEVIIASTSNNSHISFVVKFLILDLSNIALVSSTS
jgi:hypothetical protein